MHRIFSFDPGRTTGYCSIDVQDDGKDFSVVRCGEIEWSERMPALHGILYDSLMPTYVVIESFRLFPHKARAQIGSQFPSARVIGAIEAMVHLLGIGEENIKFQEPGDIVKVVVPERDLLYVAGSPHKVDAYRHARLCFLKHFYLNPFD